MPSGLKTVVKSSSIRPRHQLSEHELSTQKIKRRLPLREELRNRSLDFLPILLNLLDSRGLSVDTWPTWLHTYRCTIVSGSWQRCDGKILFSRHFHANWSGTTPILQKRAREALEQWRSWTTRVWRDHEAWWSGDRITWLVLPSGVDRSLIMSLVNDGCVCHHFEVQESQ